MSWFKSTRVRTGTWVGLTVLASTSLTYRIASNLHREDQIEILREYVFAQVKATEEVVATAVQRALQVTQLVQGSSNPEGVIQEAKEIGLKALLVFTQNAEGQLEIQKKYSDGEGVSAHLLDQLGWDSSRFQTFRYLVGRTSAGLLAVGNAIKGSDGKTSFYVSLLVPTLEKGEPGSEGNLVGDSKLVILLMNPVGELFLNSKHEQIGLVSSGLADLLDRLQETNQKSGVLSWSFKNEEYLLSYSQMETGDFFVVGFYPLRQAFHRWNLLSIEWPLLTFGIAFLSIGLILIYLKKFFAGIQEIQSVMAEIHGGNYQVGKSASNQTSNSVGELSDLSASIHLLGENLEKRMSQTIEEGVSKNRQDMMEWVERWNGTTPLEEAQLSLFGKTTSNGSYHGEGWSYRKDTNDGVWILVGRADQSGFKAALVRSAIQTVISALEDLKESSRLEDFAKTLNQTLYTVFNGSVSYACLLCRIDLKSGEVQIIDTHPSGSSVGLSRPKEKVQILSNQKNSSLGSTLTLNFTVDQFQLKSGDIFVLSSLGLNQGSPLLTQALPSESSGGVKISDVFSKLMEQVGNKEGESVVLVSVPPEVQFKTSE